MLQSTRRAFLQRGAGARGPPPWQVGESKVFVLHLPLPCALPGRRYIPPGQPQSSPSILHSRSTPGVHTALPDDAKPSLAHAPHPGPTRLLQMTQVSTASPRAGAPSPHDTPAPRPVAALLPVHWSVTCGLPWCGARRAPPPPVRPLTGHEESCRPWPAAPPWSSRGVEAPVSPSSAGPHHDPAEVR